MDQVRELGRSYTVELPILSNTNSKFSFGDNETALDNVVITGISVLSPYVGKALSGRNLMSLSDIASGFITLADSSKKEYNKQFPLEMFIRGEVMIHIKRKLISVRNCYVDLPLINAVAIPAGPPAGLAIVFVFMYEPFSADIHKINSIGEVENY